MKTAHLKGVEYLLVEVPEGANNIQLAKAGQYGKKGAKYPAMIGYEIKPSLEWFEIELPPGFTYTLIGLGSEIGEDVWKGIVESHEWNESDGWPPISTGIVVTYYREYPKELYKSLVLTATASGHSWIRSHGMEPGRTVVIKKE